MKRLLTVLISISLIISIPLYPLAESNKSLSWQKSVELLHKNNNILKDLTEAEQNGKEQYKDAAVSSRNIDTKGRTVNILGEEIRIGFDEFTQMLMTQQKELYPEQMKFYWNMTQDMKKKTSYSLVINLRNIYLGLYNAYKDVGIKERKYELADSLNNQSKIKHERGMLSEIELIESEYNLIKAKVDLEASKRNYENIQRSFNLYLCQDINTEYDEILLDNNDNVNFRELEYYLDRAQKNRAEIKQGEKQLVLLKMKKGIIDRYPLSMNTISARKDYESLLLDIEINEMKLEQARHDIEMEIQEAYVDVVTAVGNAENMKKAVDIQKTNIEKIRRLYEKGMVSKTLLDQSEIAYSEFYNGYEATLYDRNTRLMRLVYISDIGIG